MRLETLLRLATILVLALPFCFVNTRTLYGQVNQPNTSSDLVGEPFFMLKHFARVDAAIYSPDGKFLASARTQPENWIRIWDVDSGRELVRNFDEIGPITAVSFSNDGKTILTGSKILYSDFAPAGTAVILDGEIQVWDSHSGELIQTLRRKEPKPN